MYANGAYNHMPMVPIITCIMKCHEAMYTQYCLVHQTQMTANMQYISIRQTYRSLNMQ